jgi:hypothetical protein
MNDKIHLEDSVHINATPETVFAFADNPHNFSSHMNQSSMMMAGSKMETRTDEGRGMQSGSHIMMEGRVLGYHIFLDEIVTIHEPPKRKAWQTVGDINLLVIDHYILGFDIRPDDTGSSLRVYIDYSLPTGKTRVLGRLFGKMYANWCIRQMLDGVSKHFST